MCRMCRTWRRVLVNNWLWLCQSHTKINSRGSTWKREGRGGGWKSNTNTLKLPLDFSHRFVCLFDCPFACVSVSVSVCLVYLSVFDFSVFMHAFRVWRLSDTDTFYIALCVYVCVCIFYLIIAVNSFSNNINFPLTHITNFLMVVIYFWSAKEKYLFFEKHPKVVNVRQKL